MQQKTEKTFFVCKKIASQLVSLNRPYEVQDVFIGSQYVNKQSQDFACEEEKLFPTQSTWQWSLDLAI